jgi:hypothetical protein
VLVAIVQGLVRSQVTSKAAAALDEFDALSDLALGTGPVAGGHASTGRKVVVFVDDLDRVTAAVQRDVLDNLRTFFDKPALAFVVTGDYMVLEASLGRELAPNDAPSEQREQGRLFLKKIFNVYWRLPLPVQSDFESFVGFQLSDRDQAIQELIPAEADRAQLRELLVRFCDTNLRQVIRTLDNLLFCLRLVRAQAASTSDPAGQAALAEMVSQPMLVARVLMIQDRCAPLFDLFASRPSLLRDFDMAIHEAKEVAPNKEGADAVSAFLARPDVSADLKDRLAPDQRRFLLDFAFEPPLFYDLSQGGQVTRDLGPWLHLASDVNFGDEGGPAAADFARTLVNRNREGLVVQVARCSEERAPSAARAAVDELSRVTDSAEKEQLIRLLFGVCREADAERPLVKAVAAAVLDSLAALVSDLAESARPAVQLAAVALVEFAGFDVLPDSAVAALAFRGAGDLQNVPRENLGAMSSVVVLEWLADYYQQDPANCLGQLEDLLPCLNLKESNEKKGALGRLIVDGLLPDHDDSHRSTRLALTSDYSPADLNRLQELVISQLQQPDVWNWATSVAREGSAPRSEKDLQDALIEWVVDEEGGADLMPRLVYAAGRLDERSAGLWQMLADKRQADFVSLLSAIAGDAALAVLPLPESVATRLYLGRVKTVTETEDESVAAQVAQILEPRQWIWSDVNRERARKALLPIAYARAKRRSLQAVVRAFWEYWGEES